MSSRDCKERLMQEAVNVLGRLTPKEEQALDDAIEHGLNEPEWDVGGEG